MYLQFSLLSSNENKKLYQNSFLNFKLQIQVWQLLWCQIHYNFLYQVSNFLPISKGLLLREDDKIRGALNARSPKLTCLGVSIELFLRHSQNYYYEVIK